MSAKLKILNIVLMVAFLFGGFSTPAKAAPPNPEPNAIPEGGCGLYFRDAIIRGDGLSARIYGQVINEASSNCVGDLFLDILEGGQNGVVVVSIQYSFDFAKSFSWNWDTIYNFTQGVEYWVRAVINTQDGESLPSDRRMNDRRDASGMGIWIKPEYGLCTLKVQFRNDPDYRIEVLSGGNWTVVASGHLDVMPGSDWTDWVTIDLAPFASYPASDLPVRVHAEWNESGSLPADEYFTIPAGYMDCLPPPPPPMNSSART